MEKICQHCGASYEGSAQSRFHSDACRKAHARELRERGLMPDGETPVPQHPQQVVVEDSGPRSLERLLALDPYAPLSDEEEQRVRDHYGYAASETRTRAERENVARKITGKLPPSTVEDKALLGRQELQRRGLALEPTGVDTH